MKNFNISEFLNYTIRFIIIFTCIYLYMTGSLPWNRVIIFITIFLIIIGYSRLLVFINNIFNNKKVKQYVLTHEVLFRKILYILLEVHRWTNPLFIFLAYTDKCLYAINRYITGTRFLRYNFIIYVCLKYLVMFGVIKLIFNKYYYFWENIIELSIIDILFKRLYGLILSILIFTDIINYIIVYLSQYNILIYVLIYYIISITCIILEFFFFFYLKKSFLYFQYYIKKYIFGWFSLNILKIFEKIKVFVVLNYVIEQFFTGLHWVVGLDLELFTKMNFAVFYRTQYTCIGQIISQIIFILVPTLSQKTNFKERLLSVEFVGPTSFFGGSNVAYYVPLEGRLPFKYSEYLGFYLHLMLFDQTFQLYWDGFKSRFSYKSFFKIKGEVKWKPSMFLYMQLKHLANLYDSENQPINRLMYWIYFDIKYKEDQNKFDANEKLIINQNLSYLKKVDDLRARLMFFMLWDIEYFYYNNKNYNWNYWVFIFHSVLETFIFELNDRFYQSQPMYLTANKGILKFYDPEENMEFLNRTFDVLGIANNIIQVDSVNTKELPVVHYYVSEKFLSYNERYDEFIRIMYGYEVKRWEEPYCACGEFQLYEATIVYNTQQYFEKLRAEWEHSIKSERLEDRNWTLLRKLEDLMDVHKNIDEKN